jgi:hypothetical protein
MILANFSSNSTARMSEAFSRSVVDYPCMAAIVKLRAATFIPLAWLDSPREGEEHLQFRGDNREFTPHTVNTGRSRVEQEVVVDLAREDVLTYADTGRSKERVERPNGTREVHEGKADASGISVTDVAWDEGCNLLMRAEAANPLVEEAAPVTYEARATVTFDGDIQIAGVHDAFPCFEFYAQTDFEPFRRVYTYDYRESGGSPLDLPGPPECEFDVTN